MNIYDIAKACGVSTATVSRVLNGSSKVSEKTRSKVMAVMEEAKYTPNPFARGLTLNTMKMVGILCTDISDAFYAKAVSLIENDLKQRSINMILSCTGTQLSDKKKYIKLLLEKHVDALILIGSPFYEENDRSHLIAAAKKIPIIMINSLIDIPNVYCVACDEYRAILNSVKQLSRAGHRSILYLYDSLTYSGQQKLQGYKAAVSLCRLNNSPLLICQSERSLDTIDKRVREHLAQVKFTAVMASEDILATGAQKALIKCGPHLPVIGCNNSIIAECSTPSLTSIDNRLDVLCPTAVSILDDILKGNTDNTPTQMIFSPQLVYRESFPEPSKEI